MQTLRRLLLGKDYETLLAMREDIERVLALEEGLRYPDGQTDLVAGVLSEAIVLREGRDQGISRALGPAVSDAIKVAVRKDPEPVVEAVCPVIGPAIRRAVNDAIAGMLELLDKLLEHNLSWQSLQWRIEAWRTGRRYSEVVLLRTLVYRVDQVLLIHRETGLLLQHMEAPQAAVGDPDLIGSMLTAIKDFVSDSFSPTEESPVQTMQVGDYKVIVEQGRLAILAAIVRGNPPGEVTRTIQETLEGLELSYEDTLERFDGDVTTFAETRGRLEGCLKSQQRPAAERRPWLAPALLGLLVSGMLGYWGFHSYRAHALRSAALDALRNEPGIVITDADPDAGVYRVRGLRDPLARDPGVVVGSDAWASLRWEWDWRPFLSVEHDILLARARQALRPPSTVDVSLQGDVLRLSGEAPLSWVEAARGMVAGIPGIAGFREDTLEIVDPAQKLDSLWTSALGALRMEPGILVADAVRDGIVCRVRGLRDPLAREPDEVIGPEARSHLRWEWDWRPFLSAEPDLLLARARLSLQPPATVSLSLEGSILTLSGEAPLSWMEGVRDAVPGIPGVTGYRDDALEVVDHRARFRELLSRYRQEIDAAALYFDLNSVALTPPQLSRLDTLAATMKAFESVAGELGLMPRYVVTGYADATGSQAENLRLSSSRARGVIEGLVSRGVDERLFFPLKIGIGGVDRTADAPEDRARNRRVALAAVLLEDYAEAGR